jgi:hypothetical protein
MTRVLYIADPARGEEAGEFQGHVLGASVSVIVVDATPGGGPKLHKHPYEEVFVVQEGSATFTAGTTLSRRQAARSLWCRPAWRTSSSTPAPGGCGRSTYTPETISLPRGSNDRGGSITFASGSAAIRHVLTKQYIFNGEVDSREGTRVATSVGRCN